MLEICFPRKANSALSSPTVKDELEPSPDESAGYLAELGPRLRAGALERGVLLRPLGNVLYALPPACVSDDQCDRIARVMVELVRTARG